MRYKIRPVEVEAMQWHRHETVTHPSSVECARRIVAWIEANGGEARYQHDGSPSQSAPLDRIVVHTRAGWAYASPGDYIVMSDATFDAVNEITGYRADGLFRKVREFRRERAEDFESRWEAVA